MNKAELIKLLQPYPDDMEVRVINASIENDNGCPTFQITSVSTADITEDPDEDYVDFKGIVIEFDDDVYIHDLYLAPGH